MHQIEEQISAPKTRNQKWLNSADDIFSFLEKESNRADVQLFDRLTGLMTKPAFVKSLEKEIDRTKRGLSSGGLFLMIDLDNFENLRHAEKVSALKLVAKTITSDIRMMDSATRLADDNFAILLPDANRNVAQRRAQKIIRKLNNLSFVHDGKEISLRCSLGFVEYGKNDNARSVLQKAGMIF